MGTKKNPRHRWQGFGGARSDLGGLSAPLPGAILRPQRSPGHQPGDRRRTTLLVPRTRPELDVRLAGILANAVRLVHMQFKNIPDALQKIRQWVVWKKESGTKVPYVARTDRDEKASHTNRRTWRSFQTAVKAYETGRYDGIGFVLSEEDDFAAIDLDNKNNDPVLDISHLDIVKRFDSYAERSPSGTGYHIIFRSDEFKGFNQSPYEAYFSHRYMTFTGDVVLDRPIRKNPKYLKTFIAEHGTKKGERYKPPPSNEILSGSRNSTITSMVGQLLAHGLPMETVAIWTRGFNRGLPEPMDEPEVERILKSTSRYEKDSNHNPYKFLLDNLVFISAQDKYWDRKQYTLLTRTAVDDYYSSTLTGDKPPPPSKFLVSSKDTLKATQVGWLPGAPDFYRNSDDQESYNCYRPTNLTPRSGDPNTWLEFVEYLIPDEQVRNAVLDWMAFTVQQPGVKINYGLFICGGNRIGKNTLFLPLVKAVGEHNHYLVTGENLDSEFQEYLDKKKFILIDEMDTNTMKARKIEDRLKIMLASPPDEIPINKKQVQLYKIPNVISVAIISNHRDAIRITAGNVARYLCHFCEAEKRPDSYYTKLRKWMSANYDVIYDWFLRRDLSDFNPKANSLVTKFAEEIVNDSRDPIVISLEEAIAANVPPFDKDFVTARDAVIGLELRPGMEGIVAKKMHEIGYRKLEIKKRDCATKRIFIIKNSEKYENMTRTEIYDILEERSKRRGKY